MRPVTLLLTIPVVVLLTQPLWAPQWGLGILGELTALGPWGAIAAVAVFFGLVALYCRSLQRLHDAVPLRLRRRSSRSIWLMFALPLNFVEDFFIVADIGAALAQTGLPRQRVRLWSTLGHGWCALQIASLLPGPVGVGCGLLALIAWIAHWALTRSLRAQLTLLIRGRTRDSDVRA